MATFPFKNLLTTWKDGMSRALRVRVEEDTHKVAGVLLGDSSYDFVDDDNRFFGNTVGDSATHKAADCSSYSRKIIVINNTLDVEIVLKNIQWRSPADIDSLLIADLFKDDIDIEILPAESLVLTEIEYPELTLPVDGLSVYVVRDSMSVPASGVVNVKIFGGM